MMSEEKVIRLEKEMAQMQVLMPQLVSTMEEQKASQNEVAKTNIELTKANIELSHDIKSLVKGFHSVNATIEDHSKRIVRLETKNAVRESGEESATWAKKAVISSVVGLMVSALIWTLVKMQA